MTGWRWFLDGFCCGFGLLGLVVAVARMTESEWWREWRDRRFVARWAHRRGRWQQ